MKYIKYLFCGIFFSILFFFFGTTINNHNEISDLEKRTLQTFPELTIDKISDGSYMEEVTTAFSDQLEHRDLLIKGYYLFQFQRYSGDVVIGENDDLYAAYQRIADMDRMVASAELINEASSEIDAKFIFLSIPRKDAVEIQNLPENYISSDEVYLKGLGVIKEHLNENVCVIDAYEIFKNDKHQSRYYYMTDHHITPAAAELLYKELLNVIDNPEIPVYDLSKYEIGQTLINGSFNNQIGQRIKPVPEDLYIIPKFDIDYKRYEDEEPSDLSIFAEANTYEDAYMEGDHAYTVIDTNRPELPNILYAGASFTNILEAMSLPSFNKIVSIDYRHNDSGNSIQYYVEKHNIDYVVFIPSQSYNALSKSNIQEQLGK